MTIRQWRARRAEHRLVRGLIGADKRATDLDKNPPPHDRPGPFHGLIGQIFGPAAIPLRGSSGFRLDPISYPARFVIAADPAQPDRLGTLFKIDHTGRRIQISPKVTAPAISFSEVRERIQAVEKLSRKLAILEGDASLMHTYVGDAYDESRETGVDVETVLRRRIRRAQAANRKAANA